MALLTLWGRVAQLDRALDSGSRCRGFDSLRARGVKGNLLSFLVVTRSSCLGIITIRIIPQSIIQNLIHSIF